MSRFSILRDKSEHEAAMMRSLASIGGYQQPSSCASTSKEKIPPKKESRSITRKHNFFCLLFLKIATALCFTVGIALCFAISGMYFSGQTALTDDPTGKAFLIIAFLMLVCGCIGIVGLICLLVSALANNWAKTSAAAVDESDAKLISASETLLNLSKVIKGAVDLSKKEKEKIVVVPKPKKADDYNELGGWSWTVKHFEVFFKSEMKDDNQFSHQESESLYTWVCASGILVLLALAIYLIVLITSINNKLTFTAGEQTITAFMAIITAAFGVFFILACAPCCILEKEKGPELEEEEEDE